MTKDGNVFAVANTDRFRVSAAGGMGPCTRPSGTTLNGNLRSQEWAGATFSRDGDGCS